MPSAHTYPFRQVAKQGTRVQSGPQLSMFLQLAEKRTRALEAFASHVQASVYELINGIDACYASIENLRNITYKVPRIYLLLNVSVICLCATTVH